jgi:hypothetical protein
MSYEIECIGTNAGWKYRVTLWNGKARYNGDRYYMRHQDAERAARSTGAVPKSVKELA